MSIAHQFSPLEPIGYPGSQSIKHLLRLSRLHSPYPCRYHRASPVFNKTTTHPIPKPHPYRPVAFPKLSLGTNNTLPTSTIHTRFPTPPDMLESSTKTDRQEAFDDKWTNIWISLSISNMDIRYLDCRAKRILCRLQGLMSWTQVTGIDREWRKRLFINPYHLHCFLISLAR